MRRLSCFILAAGLLIILAGCGTRVQVQKEEPDKIIMTFQTLPTSRLSGLQRIEDAINEIAMAEVGVEVSLRTIDASDSYTTYPLWLSKGERIDLMVLNYQDIQSYVKNGQLLSLDGLMEQHGTGIRELINSGCDLTSGTTIDGEIYGIAVASNDIGIGAGLWVPRHYLEAADFAYNSEKIYTIDEVNYLLAKLKELYPEKYPLGQITSGNTFSTQHFFYGIQMPLGTGDISGSLDEASGKLINFYETEEYRQFLIQMREWFQLGYIYPDSAYTCFSSIELMRSGEVLSIPLTSNPGIVTEADVGAEIVCLHLSEIVATPSGPKGTFWVIPTTCRDPEKAMKFLNLMYTDERIVNLLIWGEEGQDYLFLDKDEGVITYPEGITQENASFHNPLGLYGNKRLAYSFGSGQLKKQQEDYTQKITYIGQEYIGFFFDESPVSTETWQIQQIANRYLPVLESGCVDVEENYTAFLSALKEAGIETVIAEKQRQLDAWLAGQS